jgi:predicted nucleotidyltransferase
MNFWSSFKEIKPLPKFVLLMFAIEKNTNDINKLCSKYKVKTFYVFGSALTSVFNDQIDLDFIVDFEPQDIDHYADNYFNLKFALEDTFKRKIDLWNKGQSGIHTLKSQSKIKANLCMEFEIKTWLSTFVFRSVPEM